MKLTEGQEEVFNRLFKAVMEKKILLLSSIPRKVGKTTILNELAFHLQALGYTVYINSQHRIQEFFANVLLSENIYPIRRLRSDKFNKIVVIVDENEERNIREIIEFCRENEVALIGFIRWDIRREYSTSNYEEVQRCLQQRRQRN